MSVPNPRVCVVRKWADFIGYGFNLHAEKGKPGQFIGHVDDDSPALYAGLLANDRLVEVNGCNVTNENHQQVIVRIKNNPSEVSLLVVDPDTEKYFAQTGSIIQHDMENIQVIECPYSRPEKSEPPTLNYSVIPDVTASTSETAPPALYADTNGVDHEDAKPEKNGHTDDDHQEQPVASSIAVETSPVVQEPEPVPTRAVEQDDSALSEYTIPEPVSPTSEVTPASCEEPQQPTVIAAAEETTSTVAGTEAQHQDDYVPPPTIYHTEEEQPSSSVAEESVTEAVASAEVELAHVELASGPEEQSASVEEPLVVCSPSFEEPAVSSSEVKTPVVAAPPSTELNLNMSAAEMRAKLGGNKRRVVMDTSGTFKDKTMFFHQL